MYTDYGCHSVSCVYWVSCFAHSSCYAHVAKWFTHLPQPFMHTLFFMLCTCCKILHSFAPTIHAHPILHVTHMLQNSPLIRPNHSCTPYSSCYAHAAKYFTHSPQPFMHTLFFMLRACCKMVHSFAPTIHAHPILHVTRMLQNTSLIRPNHSCTPYSSCYAHVAKWFTHSPQPFMHMCKIIFTCASVLRP